MYERYLSRLKCNMEELRIFYLVEEGTNKYDDLSDAQFKRLVRKQYKYIKDVASEGFF